MNSEGGKERAESGRERKRRAREEERRLGEEESEKSEGERAGGNRHEKRGLEKGKQEKMEYQISIGSDRQQ